MKYKPTQEEIAQVSAYATKNDAEFFAEVLVAKLNGEKLAPSIEKMYSEFINQVRK